MSELGVIWTMRAMAWERAKGELQSMFCTYVSEIHDDYTKYEKMKEAYNKFVAEVEDNGLAE